MKYLIATGNPHKVEAIRRILAEFGLELAGLSEFPPMEEPIEDGDSFLSNALIKSRYYSKATGLIALADDSGLEIDALGGQPGIHSSRFGGPDSPYSDKMAQILKLLGDTPEESRTARFRCVASATFPDGRELHAEGSMDGIILNQPRGEGGFGYDPILYIPRFQKTVAELSPAEKDEFSHRGAAFRHLAALLANSGKSFSER